MFQIAYFYYLSLNTYRILHQSYFWKTPSFIIILKSADLAAYDFFENKVLRIQNFWVPHLGQPVSLTTGTPHILAFK